eukprot:363414-Chlamydomonas_euryale.AAC.4
MLCMRVPRQDVGGNFDNRGNRGWAPEKRADRFARCECVCFASSNPSNPYMHRWGCVSTASKAPTDSALVGNGEDLQTPYVCCPFRCSNP